MGTRSLTKMTIPKYSLLLTVLLLFPCTFAGRQDRREKKRECAGDHGSKVGDAVCCGQPGTISEEDQICRRDRPHCEGFVQGSKWENANTNESVLIAVVTAGMDLIIRTVEKSHAGDHVL